MFTIYTNKGACCWTYFTDVDTEIEAIRIVDEFTKQGIEADYSSPNDPIELDPYD